MNTQNENAKWINEIRPMLRIKSVTAAPDFKSPSRHANGRIFDICVRWRNAEGGLTDKQMGDFILTMGLIGRIVFIVFKRAVLIYILMFNQLNLKTVSNQYEFCL